MSRAKLLRRSRRTPADSAPTTPAAPPPAPKNLKSMFFTHPAQWGFTVTLGVLGALVIALAVINLRSVLLSVFIAAFVALGLDPLVRWFQRKGLKRATALVTVMLLFVVVVVGVVWAVVPTTITQVAELVNGFPAEVKEIQSSDWFKEANSSSDGIIATIVNWGQTQLSDPNFWASVGGGALAFGAAVFDGISSGIFIFILSIYFIASLDTIKRGFYSLASASNRPSIENYSEQIMLSVGRYLSGMVVLAFANAVYSVILLSLVGSPYALLIGVVALFVTLIPLVGTIITTCIMTVVALFTSPVAAIIVLIGMLIYMQVEAYVLTPRVMSKAVQVPGSVVLISALAGGTLLGLLGALVAIPISAGIMLIIREIVIPKKQLM